MHIYGILVVILIIIFAEEILHVVFGPLAEGVALYAVACLAVLLFKLSIVAIAAAFTYLTPILGAGVIYDLKMIVYGFIAVPLPIIFCMDSHNDFRLTTGLFRMVVRRRVRA